MLVARVEVIKIKPKKHDELNPEAEETRDNRGQRNNDTWKVDFSKQAGVCSKCSRSRCKTTRKIIPGNYTRHVK